jgi:hypothetical protein
VKTLNIISNAYRATLEEQDDTIVWLTHAMRYAGADVDILLRGPAVNYVVKGQEVAPLSIGGREQKHAPDVYGQVETLAGKGAKVYVLAEDVKGRGLRQSPRLDAAELVSIGDLPELFEGYEQIWHW